MIRSTVLAVTGRGSVRKLVTETMLVAGVNDTDESLQATAAFLAQIHPARAKRDRFMPRGPISLRGAPAALQPGDHQPEPGGGQQPGRHRKQQRMKKKRHHNDNHQAAAA